MNNLYEILAQAEDGEAMDMLGRQFGLSPEQTQAAVMALLPAISTGIKQATATPEGLGTLFSVMGQQSDLQAMYGAPDVAFAPQGRAAGNDVLSVIFGSPDVSLAVVDQAQRFSGVTGAILKKMLPVIAGIIISGLMGGRSGQSAPKGSPASPTGGVLGDILGQIFGRNMPGGAGVPSPAPQFPVPGGQPMPMPTDAGGQGGDLLGHILRELEKGIREGRIKPVIIDGGQVQLPGGGGRVQFPMPGGQREPAPMPMPDSRQQQPSPQMPGGDILGQILRDLLGGGGGPGRAPQQRAPQQRAPQQRGPSPELKDLSDLSKQLGVMGGVGSAVFGDRIEVGRDVQQEHLESIQGVFDRFFGTQRR